MRRKKGKDEKKVGRGDRKVEKKKSVKEKGGRKKSLTVKFTWRQK